MIGILILRTLKGGGYINHGSTLGFRARGLSWALGLKLFRVFRILRLRVRGFRMWGLELTICGLRFLGVGV